jgi:hypothetical protein
MNGSHHDPEGFVPSGAIESWLASAPSLDRIESFSADKVHPHSVTHAGAAAIAMARLGPTNTLLVCGPGAGIPDDFRGVRRAWGGTTALFCPLDSENARALRALLPHTAPSPLSAAAISIGTGDRVGTAGPGVLRLLKNYAAAPVLAQQSVRELTLMGRTYQEVLDAATWAAFREGYREPWGADADHLKDVDWVRRAIEAGFTMVTADVSDFLHGAFLAASHAELASAYAALDAGYRAGIEARFLGRSFALDCGERIAFSAADLQRTALAYHAAIDHARRLHAEAVRVAVGRSFDFELSIDETTVPTSGAAHLFVAAECARAGVRLTSLAPRFVGEFQKAVDYIGDADAFARDLTVHASIARMNGYRLSIHSGSDKYAVFPAISRLTRGRFHLKTSGTSWLEALRLMAGESPALFRTWFARAAEAFDDARAYYHVTPDLRQLPRISDMPDGELPDILNQAAARQVLHITYGEVMKNAELKRRAFTVLRDGEECYLRLVAGNLERHLQSLEVPRRETPLA